MLHFIAALLVLSTTASASLPEGYEDLSAAEKCTILLHNVQDNPYTELPTAANGPLSMLKLFSPKYLLSTFTHVSDELPQGRKKLIHTYGATAAVEMRINEGSPYTGIFASGARGFARLSLASTDANQFTPGMGLKFPLSGRDSVNMVVMPSLDGQGTDLNAFRSSYASTIPAPTRLNFLTRRLLVAFQNTVLKLKASFHSGPVSERNLPVAGGALYTVDGSEVANPVIPEEFIYEPSAALTASLDQWIAANQGRDFREGLAAVVTEGTVLGRVLLKGNEGTEAQAVGELIARSSFIASPYQDERLFFRHQYRLR